ncbi:MAG: cardiolipin synthase [Lachnospiraceae bacterium]|nr:cardiolipin synthase [Lachnospiraceae bacterium]
MKRIAKLFFSRLFIIALAILMQLFWFLYVFLRLSRVFTSLNIVLSVVALVLMLHVINRRMNPYGKLAWCVIILGFPLLGVLLYILLGRSELTKRTRKRLEQVNQEILPHLSRNPEYEQELKQTDTDAYLQSEYIAKWAGAPLYRHTQTRYYGSGEEMFESLLKDIQEAKSYIFMEYFILDEGYMLQTIIDALEKKVQEGVKVRLIYDDMGCVSTLPSHFDKALQKKGIDCAVFNRLRPMISVIMNNRDHRKILVVDGRIAYTGGVNLADEYINRISRFGYWKDSGIRLEGEAVWSFTCMFLEMWNYIKRSSENCEQYRSALPLQELPSDGFVQPYSDSPLDRERIAENVYLNIIQKAEKYVYIFTPYLITGNELLVALCNAAKSGVDVRIVTPGIPDKKLVYLMTQADYAVLIESGVKIYHYSKGFMHAKNFVCDDKIATVGSVNLDFRSLYLHFECGVFLYDSAAVKACKQDALQVIRESREVDLEFCRHRKLPVRLLQSVLRLFAPLL